MTALRGRVSQVVDVDVGTAGGGESDAELWHLLRSADEDAFRDLFLRHNTAVYNFCFRRTASWSVAEDATQATFASLWRRASGGDIDPLKLESARPALLTMARNECSNANRSRNRHLQLVDRVRTESGESVDNTACLGRGGVHDGRHPAGAGGTSDEPARRRRTRGVVRTVPRRCRRRTEYLGRNRQVALVSGSRPARPKRDRRPAGEFTMRLELPPERQLPNPEWMVERILTAQGRATTGRRPAARTYWLSGLVAAAVVITAAVIGWTVLVPTGRPQVGAPPETSTVATAGPSTSGARPWALEDQSPHPRLDPRSTTPGPESPPRNAATTLAPTRPASSAAKPKSSAAILRRAPLRHRPKRSAEPPLTTTVPIGVRVHAPYLDLTASGTMTGGDVYAILVETCVRSLPPECVERPAAEPQFLDAVDELGNGDH